jgi:chemotaxis family two-component system response regulator Rcp1
VSVHILLVEDNPHDVFFVQQALTRIAQPVTLSIMQDGEQALAFLFHQEPYTQVEQPDIILLDINMPRKSGFDVLAALERDPHLKFIPVIVLTSSAEPTEINRCYELGANAYLNKPMNFEDLYTLLRATIEFWSRCKFRTRAH